MKTTGLAMLCLLVLSASKCKKEGSNCHHDITITNHSNNAVIAALRFKNPEGKCTINGPVILPGERHLHNGNGCWEDKLKHSDYELYLVDPGHYNPPGVFYSCDSIEYKNTVLKHFVLTLEDLKNTDFVVSYP